MKITNHIIINNGAHDSVGGQPTLGFDINFIEIAKSCGYKNVFSCSSEDQIAKYIKLMGSTAGPSLLEIKVNKGARESLGRPTISPIENKKTFMKYLEN